MLKRTALMGIAASLAILEAAAGPPEPLWEPLPAGDSGLYAEIDRSSLAWREGRLTVWLRLSFAAPVHGRELWLRSAVAEHAVDCRQRRHAAMRMTTYSQPLGEGEVIDRWDRSPSDWSWRPDTREALDAELVRSACDQAPATARSSVIVSRPA